MKYRQKLLELIFDDNDNAMTDWITAQPIIDHADIFRELKTITEEAAAENSDNINDIITNFDKFGDKIDEYEDQVLDEKLAEANYVIALEEQEKVFAEMDEKIVGVRRYIMNCIINNEENAEAMLEMAKKLIQSEIDNNLFVRENWADILEDDSEIDI